MTATRQFKNDFALDLYGLLRRHPGNLFFSPFSIRTALGMVCAGARGETAAEMSQALGFAASDEANHAAVAALTRRLSMPGAGQYEVAIANSLWSQEGAPLRKEFLDLVERHYAGGFSPVDFRRDPESARALINQWAEDRTRRRVRDLVPAGGVNAETRLVLANAVYFKGAWETPFLELATWDEAFHLESGEDVSAPLMRCKLSVRYVQAGGYQAVDLEYHGGDLSMLVLLPDLGTRLQDFEASLSVDLLESCIAKLEKRKVELFLPRFELAWAGELRSHLVALGMPLAFDRRQADLSGINGHEPPHQESLFLSAVLHKTFVEVNERGTEAAAATATVLEILMQPASKPPPVPVFRADHPFLFAIRDRASGAILFLGRLADPRRDG